ncbi:MAG: DUF1801 domain-containing protein [Bryobacterales bacterium]|nr:DUF1801 domain-containing protein [Bryobacterales bacterium]
MAGQFASVDAYLASLPEDRREALSRVRAVILENLPKGYEEGIQYGMIGYFVPHGLYPAGYHCDPKQPLPFASMASQKNHMAIYLFCLYFDDAVLQRFREAWERTGKRLDMGKSCIRFKKVEAVALDVLGDAIRAMPVDTFVAQYEAGRAKTAKK